MDYNESRYSISIECEYKTKCVALNRYNYGATEISYFLSFAIHTKCKIHFSIRILITLKY